MSKSAIQKQYALVVGEKSFAVFVYLENRYDCRASIGQKGIHIRLSKYMSEHERFDQEMELLDWAKKYIARNGYTHQHARNRQYRDGDTLKIMGREFLIRINYVPDKNASNGHMKQDVIHLQLSEGMSPKQEQKHKTYLVSRLIGNLFQPQIAQRVQQLNDFHFKRPIKKLRLRDNVSNWGSCAADGSINICDLVSKEKYGLIEAALKDFDGTSANPVKSKLGNDVSYGEIKLVMAALGIKQQHSTD